MAISSSSTPHLVAHPVTASFLTDPTLVPCLKQAQKQYFESLLRARLDADYVVDRQRIGQVHADVGLEPPWFLGAYNQYLQYTFRQFAAHCGGDLGCYVEGTLALLKLLLLDMGLALDPYFARTVHTPGIDPARTEEVREPSRLLGSLCWRGFAPINWCWGPVWERVRHGSWRGRLRGGSRKPSNLVGCKWRLSSRSARASAGQFRYANLGLCAGR